MSNNKKNKSQQSENPFDKARAHYGLDKQEEKMPSRTYQSSEHNLPEYILPKDTRELFESFQKTGEIQNFSLELNHFVKTQENDKKEFEIAKLFSVQYEDKGKLKTKVNKPKRKIGTDIDYKSLIKQVLNQANNLCSLEPIKLKVEPQWRFVIGLGSESIHETAITLHHVYGIPYIPAEAEEGFISTHITYIGIDEKKVSIQPKPKKGL